MAFFPVSPPENERVCPEPSLATNKNCIGYSSDWTTPCNVQAGVRQGERLRACKPSVPRRSEVRLAVDYVRPCTEKQSFRENQSRCHRHRHDPCYDIYNTPCPPPPPCGCCPQTSTARAPSHKKYNPCLPCHRQCPLELAAPTKRHCLDTWRSKSHCLPDFMVERMRQYVMDEKPLVAIPEAINCFKRRVSNRCYKSCKPGDGISDACMSDIRKFSAIFAYCIAQKLDKPLNIVLNPELEKISKIISYEISGINRKNKCDKNKKNKHNKQMQDEVSKKITVWVEDVLVDMKDKLLEDELRELEEKEGPVLDIIYDLIDNVIDSIEPLEPPADHTSGNVSENDEADEQKPKDKSEISDSGSCIFTPKMLNADLNDDEYAGVLEQPIGDSNTELHQADLDVTKEFTDITIDNLHLLPDGFEAVPDGLDTGNEDLTGETANVSETFKKYSEESHDEKKFSYKDGVGRGIESARRSPQNIKFAPPNKDLLSDADELWPEHLPKITAKLSSIVSKSITTLGFLDEKEEKKSMADPRPLISFSLGTLSDSEKRTKHSKDGEINRKQLDADILKKIEMEEVEVAQSNLKEVEADQQILKTTETITILDGGEVDYRVDKTTAPSWTLTGCCDYGCGDTDNSVEDRYRDDNCVCDRYLRIWATNLDIMCYNLQTWHDWIEITCKNIRHIKRKSERYRSTKTYTCREKDVDSWMKLKRYINKDARFWLKFKHNEKRRLKSYKCIYKLRAKRGRPAVKSNKCTHEKNEPGKGRYDST